MRVHGALWLAKRLSLNLNFSFLNRIRYFSYQVATQLSSRGWEDSVPDPILPEKCLGHSRELNPGPLGWQSDVLTTIPNRWWYIYRVLKNYVYNVSGMIEEVKTNMFFIWQNFGLCTVLPLDGLTCRCLDFRHNTHRLVLFVLLCLRQVERVSTKTCYDKYSKYVCVYYPFSCHSIPAMLKHVYVCTTWRFPVFVVHSTQLIHHRWLSTL